MNGEFEVFIKSDQTKFVLETIGQGTVINSNNFLFLEQEMQVNVQAVTQARILLMPITKFTELRDDNKQIDRKVALHMNRILKK